MKKQLNKIIVVGLGYVGLPTLVAIDKTKKYEVLGFDVDKKKVDLIASGKSPIEDKEVSEYLINNKLNVSSKEDILKGAQIFIICVPTPVFDDYTPDYSIVEKATKTIAPYLAKGCHFVLESTVNPGTCEEIVQPILEKISGLKAGVDFNLVHCPERINPGDPKWTIYNINRNIGSINKQFNREIAEVYRSFIPNALVNEVSSLKIAEATKIIENTFRDINIAYVNELAKSFDAMGIDLYETIKASSNKPFGFMPHYPGCGVGGHCIAVDPYYLIQRAALSGFDHRFLKLAREINNSMPEYAVEKLLLALNQINKPIKNTKITLLGLAYKANLGDQRESPALEIKNLLLELEADLVVYDPFIKEGSTANSLQEAVSGAVAIVIATAHQEFIDHLPSLLNRSDVKIVVDGRNCLNKNQLDKKIIYRGIGR